VSAGLVRREDAGPVAVLRLADGERSNPLSPDLVAALRERLGGLGDARAVVLAAEGRNFCSGGDHDALAALDRDRMRAYLTELTGLFADLGGCPVPLVAAVPGAAVGGGVDLALLCDLVLAADRAWFALPQVRVGGRITRDSHRLLLARTGLGFTRRLTLLGDRVPAAEALAAGLVDAVHPADRLEAAALELAGSLAERDPRRLGRIRDDLRALVREGAGQVP
jgi:enoyl-CoA hydratase/carnithine racemase